MIFFGIDPGLATTGYGFLESKKGVFKPLGYGCITTNKASSFLQRLNRIHAQLSLVLEKTKPDWVAVEKLFFCKNVKTALDVGQARGVILLTAQKAGIPVAEFTPLQVKQTLTGYGRADKKQIQRMLCSVLSLAAAPESDDAADALAIAYCCAVHNRPVVK